MPQLLVQISEEQAAWLDSQCNRLNPKSRLIRDLIDTARQGLTPGLEYAPTVSVRNPTNTVAVSAVQPSETAVQPEASKAVSAVPSKKGKFEPRVTDPLLENFSDEVISFWKTKKGSKNENAWKLLQTELVKIINKYGEAVAREQLANGIQAGTWQSLTLTNYERFKPRAATAAQEQPNNHPASRVFTAADFDTPNPDNPLNNLF